MVIGKRARDTLTAGRAMTQRSQMPERAEVEEEERRRRRRRVGSMTEIKRGFLCLIV